MKGWNKTYGMIITVEDREGKKEIGEDGRR